MTPGGRAHFGAATFERQVNDLLIETVSYRTNCWDVIRVVRHQYGNIVGAVDRAFIQSVHDGRINPLLDHVVDIRAAMRAVVRFRFSVANVNTESRLLVEPMEI